MKTDKKKIFLTFIIATSILLPSCTSSQTSSQQNTGAFYTAGQQTSNGYVFTYQKVPSAKQLDDIVKKVCERFDNVVELYEKNCKLGFSASNQADREFVMLGFNNLDASDGNKFFGSNIRFNLYRDFYQSQLWQSLSSAQKELLETKMQSSDSALFFCQNKIDEDVPDKTTISSSSNSQQNLSKLLALLANPMSASLNGQFTKGDKVVIPRALLSVINVQNSNNSYYYLAAVNDYNVTKPFYILSNRRLNLMDLEFHNTIFEDLELEYIGKRDYYSSKVRQETFIFKLSSMK